MNSLFAYQPELLSSINVILSPVFFGISLVTLIGVLLVSSIVLLILFKKKNTNNIIIGSIIVFWLPLFAHFFYNNILEIRQTFFMVNEPYHEQVRWRYCSIDYHQHLGGSLCQVQKFSEFIHQNIPEGSQIAFASNPVALYLEYQLVDRYMISNNLETADYILLYHSQENFHLSNEGRLSRIEFSEDKLSVIKEHFYGYFTVKDQINNQLVIFKRM